VVVAPRFGNGGDKETGRAREFFCGRLNLVVPIKNFVDMRGHLE
jgi:hypothetical protein